MEKLKDILSREALEKISIVIEKNYPKFRKREFVDETWIEICSLELKDRIRKISQSLRRFLPEQYPHAIKVILDSSLSDKNPEGLSGFLAWPFTQFIEDYGLEHFDLSVDAMKKITSAMSAEFAIRPFLKQNPEKLLNILAGWAKDKNLHVRRLVSEGTRPLLPWGQQLPLFKNNPELTLPLLRALAHSEELYVRKSIANHLNDISKHHPKLLIQELKAWRKNYPNNENLEWVYRHGLRTLIKQGNQDALKFLGYAGDQIRIKTFSVSPTKLKLGEKLKIRLSFVAAKSSSLMIDYAVHHRKANGSLKPKVFKWKKCVAQKGEEFSLEKLHSIQKISTRKYYDGKHELEIMINGVTKGKKSFHLTLR